MSAVRWSRPLAPPVIAAGADKIVPDLLSELRPIQGKGGVKVADGVAHVRLTLETDAAADLIAAWRGR